MVTKWIPVAFSLAIAAALLFTLRAPEATAQASGADPVERGRYLVNEVAQCVQCHSPRSRAGQIDRTQLMKGAPVEVGAPPWIGDAWAPHAPNAITFARGRTDYTITLLTTGARPDGTVPKSPMPQYGMSRADAEAVVAYLRSLR